MKAINLKLFMQSIVAFLIGIVIFLAGNTAGILPEFSIPLGILMGVGGVVGMVLSLIVRDAQ